MQDGQSASLSESISDQLNGAVLAWSGYTSSTAQNYWWNYIFIPKERVLRHSGQSISMLLGGQGYIGYKCVYVSANTITGNNVNSKTSYACSGVNTQPSAFVLRYVYGV